MADYERLGVVLTSSDSATLKEAVDGSKIWSRQSALLDVLNTLKAGKKTKAAAGARVFYTLAEFPERSFLEVTAEAAAGDTSLTVDNSEFIRTGVILGDGVNRQNVYVNDMPGTTTTVPCEALAVAIPAKTRLQVMPPNTPELHNPGTPRSRGAARLVQTVSKFQESFAASLEAINYRERYGGSSLKLRLEKQMLARLAQQMENIVLYSRQDTGSGNSMGLTLTMGLQELGEKYGSALAPGSINLQWIFDQSARLVRGNTSGGPVMLGLICSQRMVFNFAKAIIATGNNNIRTNRDLEDSVYGVKEPVITMPIGGLTYRFIPCESFDQKGYGDQIIITNFGNVYLSDYGERTYLGPTSQRPNGVATLGSGTVQWQVDDFIGMAYPWPFATATLGYNIRSVRVL